MSGGSSGSGWGSTSDGWSWNQYYQSWVDSRTENQRKKSTPSGQAAAPADARNKKLVGQLKEAQARERDRDREEVR